jgi:phenylalanyl-tRNA synthetase alpha chain
MNVPDSILSRIERNLANEPNHPLEIIKRKIYEQLAKGGRAATHFDYLSPVVTTADNFDRLLIPSDHVSRQMTDTYYLTDNVVLRTHTSAHQTQLLQACITSFAVSGNVFRRDAIDRYHYPIFHQMEGVHLLPVGATIDEAANDLHETLKGLINHLFPGCEYRVVDSEFPFTTPSFEYEVNYNGQWVEVLGCGLIQPAILDNCNFASRTGWAFGLGLERLAMVLFDIPDIRLFWTNDPRFHKQFTHGEIVKYQPFSNQPACYKDVAFWLPANYNSNDLYEIVRDVAGDLVEDIQLLDEFQRDGKTSHCYRILYRAVDHTLTNVEIDVLQNEVRGRIIAQLGAELR